MLIYRFQFNSVFKLIKLRECCTIIDDGGKLDIHLSKHILKTYFFINNILLIFKGFITYILKYQINKQLSW